MHEIAIFFFQKIHLGPHGEGESRCPVVVSGHLVYPPPPGLNIFLRLRSPSFCLLLTRMIVMNTGPQYVVARILMHVLRREVMTWLHKRKALLSINQLKLAE